MDSDLYSGRKTTENILQLKDQWFSDDSNLDLKSINLPNEIIPCLEREEDLAEVLGSRDNIEELTMAHKDIASYENLNIKTNSNESLYAFYVCLLTSKLPHRSWYKIGSLALSIFQ